MRIIAICTLLHILFSCKKEVISVPVKEAVEQSNQETFIPEFIEYNQELTVCVGGWAGGCQGSSQFHSHGIRLLEGLEYNGMYFYSIETSLIRYNECDTFYNSGWQSLNKYYRYSFDEKKSFEYSSIYDSVPELLFDFNCVVGDTLLINQDKLARMVVTDVGQLTINGVNFPIVKGQIVSFCRYGTETGNYDDISTGCAKIVLTPFSPNPFWTGYSLNSTFDLPWSNDQFCVEVTAASVFQLGMRCQNMLNNQSSYNYGFLVPY